MRKFFYFFPGGLPGIGLLLLRGLIAVTMFAQGAAYLRSPNLTGSGWLIAGLLVASSLSLLAGFMTPIAAMLVVCETSGFILDGFPLPVHNVLDSNVKLLYLLVVAIAVAALGPGALSVDARMFGRREIRIPRST